jgi:uncharacterized protein
VILVDANLLIYAVTNCPQEERAREWLDRQISEAPRVGLPWQSLVAFLRIVTEPRIYGTGTLTVQLAWGQIEAWLSNRSVWIPLPTDRHASILKEVLRSTSRGGNSVPDAHLAALAIEHGLTLCSADRGFTRFPALRWMNPLRDPD